MTASAAPSQTCPQCNGYLDFEGLTPGTAISSQYTVSDGLTVTVDGMPSATATVVVSGGSELGYLRNDSSRNVPANPARGTGSLSWPSGRKLVLNFDPPVSSVTFVLIDLDGGEGGYVASAFNQNRLISPGGNHVVSAPAGTGDGSDTFFAFSQVTGDAVGDITRVEIVTPSGADFALDDLRFARSPWVRWDPPVGNGHEYRVISTLLSARRDGGKLTWDETVTRAAQLGGQLATLTSAAENTFAFNLAASPLHWTPLSAADGRLQGPIFGAVRLTDASFGWINDEPFAYSNWLQTGPSIEPNNLGSAESRTHFWTNSVANPIGPTWNDISPDAGPGSFIIERSCLRPTRPNNALAQNGAARLDAPVSGQPPIAYQWRRAVSPGVFVDLTDGPTPSGSILQGTATFSLTITNITASDAGEYDCVVSNTCESYACGGSATLLTPVTIAIARAQPLGRRVILGDVAINNRTDVINSFNFGSLTLEDQTGAITVFGTESAIASIGGYAPPDSNVLTTFQGTTNSFYGTFELIGGFSLLRADAARPPTLVTVTAADLAPQSPTAESLESRVVELAPFTFPDSASASLVVGDYVNQGVNVRVPTTTLAAQFNQRFGGYPRCAVRVRGVFSQFQDPPIPPIDRDYQIVATRISPMCEGDYSCDGEVNLTDLFLFLDEYFSANPRADVNASGLFSPQDLFDFLILWFTPC